jgi:SAM-dependent methyltransferase
MHQPLATLTPGTPRRADYDELVEALHGLARRIEAEEAGAEAALAGLMATLADHPDARCVGLYVFAAGLARRLAGAAVEQANLYLSRFEVPQIHLFNLLGRAVPFVGLATQMANQAIMRAIAGQARPTVIDVGIGTGRQVGVLLESLAAAGRLPRLLTVIGIEPSAWALDEARRHIEATAACVGAEVSFFGVVASAEALTPGEWHQIRQACTHRPVVNASFALHHIADDEDGADQRNDVLRHLRAINPALLVLAEPDVDHLEPRFYRRFANCLAHFGAVFRTLDRLPLSQDDRNALKVGFFGREIADVLASPESQRSERHESAAAWLARLDATGFDVSTDEAASQVAGSGPVRVARHPAHLSLDAMDEPVVALFTATPRPVLPRSPSWSAESAMY